MAVSLIGERHSEGRIGRTGRFVKFEHGEEEGVTQGRLTHDTCGASFYPRKKKSLS